VLGRAAERAGVTVLQLLPLFFEVGDFFEQELFFEQSFASGLILAERKSF